MKKYLWILLFGSLILCDLPMFAMVSSNTNEGSIVEKITTKNEKFSKFKSNIVKSKTKSDWIKWLPLGLGIIGVALVFIPYLSLIGLISGVLALALGILWRKKYPKTARWGIWLGGFCLLAFFAVLGLILFF